MLDIAYNFIFYARILTILFIFAVKIINRQKNMKKALVILQLLMVVLFAQAQMMNPVKFTSSLKTMVRLRQRLCLLVRFNQVGTFIQQA